MPLRPPNPVLEIRNLRVERGDAVILRDISWTVRAGEHWIILGPNGCGKTSLLKTLTAYLTPSSGEISVFGEKFGETDWRELRRQIGLVTSAIHSMIPDAEVARDTVVSGKYAMLDLWGTVSNHDRKLAAELLEVVNAGDLADRPWLFLSQGERQRILVARAMMAKPKLLILDEACGGLDPVAREHFLTFIDRLARSTSRTSVILVTHHVEEIMPAFSHVLMLRNGSVSTAGPKEVVLNSADLGRAFGTSLRLKKKNDRYRLAVLSSNGKAF